MFRIGAGAYYIIESYNILEVGFDEFSLIGVAEYSFQTPQFPVDFKFSMEYPLKGKRTQRFYLGGLCNLSLSPFAKGFSMRTDRNWNLVKLDNQKIYNHYFNVYLRYQFRNKNNALPYSKNAIQAN